MTVYITGLLLFIMRLNDSLSSSIVNERGAKKRVGGQREEDGRVWRRERKTLENVSKDGAKLAENVINQ